MKPLWGRTPDFEELERKGFRLNYKPLSDFSAMLKPLVIYKIEVLFTEKKTKHKATEQKNLKFHENGYFLNLSPDTRGN